MSDPTEQLVTPGGTQIVRPGETLEQAGKRAQQESAEAEHDRVVGGEQPEAA